MAPKKPGGKKAPGVNLLALGKKSPNRKKPPPPPACFKPEDIARFKEVFKVFDTDQIELVKVTAIPTMLRFIGFNPKGAEIQEILKKFLEDEFQDMIDVNIWYYIIEAKKNIGDDVEHDVELAMAFLGHDDEEKPTEIIKLETLQAELMEWGEPLTELEWSDWPKVATKDRTYTFETGDFNYIKFIDNMNSKDVRFLPEPINYFKLDQKTLAALAMQKASEERDEIRRRETERAAREQAKRQKMIESGLLQASDLANLPPPAEYKEPPNAFDILNQGL